MFGGKEVIVFSRTLKSARPGVRIVDTSPVDTVRELKQKPGKDIWLFGGGSMFRTLADAGLVDTVEVAIMPVLLSQGVPLVPDAGSTGAPDGIVRGHEDCEKCRDVCRRAAWRELL